jgi:hypothetical protein
MVVSALLAGGCTVANPGAEVGLDEPATLYAHGVADGSAISVHRQGSIDPDGHDQLTAVRDASLILDAAADKVRVRTLTLTLDDMDMPPSPQVPDGLKIRAQKLSIEQPMTATVRARGPLVLDLALDGSMRYSSGMQLADGSVYPLGASDAFGAAQLTVTRAADGSLTVRLDAQPAGDCATVGDLLTLSQCAMTVELSSVLIEAQ